MRFRLPALGALKLPLIGLLFLVVCSLIGQGLVRMALVDYSSYTERVTAVVTEVEPFRDKNGNRRERIYVDYQVGQEYFEHQHLSGSWSSTPQEGDTVELAFPPGAPEDAVTVSMLDEGTQQALLWVGIGVIAFGVVLFVVLLWVSCARRAGRPR